MLIDYVVCKHFMIREYKLVANDDEFQYLSEETRKDVAQRSEKLVQESEAHKNWQEMIKNNFILYSEKNKLP